MEFITENTIKRATLRFFKAYYRLRPRTKEFLTVSKFDVTTPEGVIVDVYYSFQKPDRTYFIATAEATSYYSKNEIRYRLQKRVLFWDSLALSSLLTAFTLTWLYAYRYEVIHTAGLLLTGGACVLGMTVFYLLYRTVAMQFHRYRYIYAVEQFKRYHADEQWVAFGEDVFENYNDKYLRELKNQCIINGFGLVKITKRLEPQVLITPTRHELFHGKRKRLSNLDPMKIMGKIKFKQSDEWWQKIFGRFKKSPDDFDSVLRFQRTYWTQLLIVLLALLLMSVVFVREMARADLVTLDREEYLETIQKIEATTDDEESTYYEVDSSYQVAVDPQTWWADQDLSFPLVLKDAPPVHKKTTPPASARQIIVGQGNQPPVIYDCSRFYNLFGKKYLIIAGEYATNSDALEQLVFFESKGFSVGIVWLGCFSDETDRFVVYFNEFYADKDQALAALEDLDNRSEILDKSLSIKELQISN